MKFKDLFPVLDCYWFQLIGNNERLGVYEKMLFPWGNRYRLTKNIDFDAWMDCEVQGIDAWDKSAIEIAIDISHAYLDEPEPDYEESSPIIVKLFPEEK